MNTAVGAIVYNHKVVRQFSIMTAFWGLLYVGLSLVIAAQEARPEPFFDFPFGLHSGRLRPLRTNIMIFAFFGSALFATSYYFVQRSCKARLISDYLAAFTFWGWQTVNLLNIVGFSLALYYQAINIFDTLLLGHLETLLVIIWGAYAVAFFGTIIKRNTTRVPIVCWLYGAFIVVMIVPYVGNKIWS